MSPASLEPTFMDPTAKSVCSVAEQRSFVDDSCFAGLRSFRWRVNLGILPSPPSASIDDVRRVTADSRRRYAGLRRRLLVDPHVTKDRNNTRDLCMDNPLSQNPDSTWSRFFRNAELERMVDQDLSRLYPEHGNYFQNTGCLGMLRRILLLWCLRHPEYGYRQGMHELLAPLFYVLNVDIERLSEVRKLYEDHFTDKYDGISFLESDNTYSFDFRRSPDHIEDENDSPRSAKKVRSLDELDSDIQTIVLLSDAYGAEGELGVVLSEKFMEHDAYCMFDALMSGSNGVVAMADFFYSSPACSSQPSVPPVIEASAALYHLLSIADSSIHSHLVELGVEPQYFALRWLRVLFGREFSLEDLLIIWDEIFASDNEKLDSQDDGDSDGYKILNSRRGAFISAMAVSMILHMRSSLLATENATVCLKRLLNFPEHTDVKKLIEKAKSLQVLALDSNISSSTSVKRNINHSKSMPLRSHSLSSDFASPSTPPDLVRESYWEEKWRDLHKEEEIKQDDPTKPIPQRRKGWAEKVKSKLSRTESVPVQGKADKGRKDQKPSVRRKLLEDLSRVLGSVEDDEKFGSHEDVIQQETEKDPLSTVRMKGQDNDNKIVSCSAEAGCPSAIDCSENSSIFSDPTSPLSGLNEHDNDSEKSSTASNLTPGESNENLQGSMGESTHPFSSPLEDFSLKHENNIEAVEKSTAGLREKKLLGKFQWFRKFGWNGSGEGTSAAGPSQAAKPVDNDGYTSGPSTAFASRTSSFRSGADSTEQNGGETLKSLGQSMLEHIQVIESVFQQDSGQAASTRNRSKNVLVVKGQVTAVEALKELRKISNILSEM